MKTRNKRIAGLAAVGVLVGGGLAGAFAATSGQDDQAADLASALSQRTGEQVSAADVKGAFTDVLKERLQQDVQSGRITQAQADEMLKRAATAPLPGMDGPGHGRGHHGRGMHEIGDAIAKKLGMTEQQLHDAREQGKTLAQVAKSKGVDKAELITTVSAAIGKSDRGSNLTDAQAKQMATDIVNGTGERGGHHRGGPGGGAVEDAMVKALGITEEAWHTAREAGKTPAQVAGEKGVEASVVVDAVAAALAKQGPPPGGAKLNDAQLKQMATDIVNGQGHGGHGDHGDHGDHGHDGPHGHMPPQGP